MPPRRSGARTAAVVLAALVAACAPESATGSRPRGAGATASTAARETADQRARFAEAVALVEAGGDEPARARFLELLGSYPALEDYHLWHLALIEERAGRIKDAAAYADRLLTGHPESVWVPRALAHRAWLALALDEPEKAEALAARALAAADADDATRARALLVQAERRARAAPREAYELYRRVRRSGVPEPAAIARERSRTLERAHPALLEDGALLVEEGRALTAERRFEEAEARLGAAAAAPEPQVRSDALRALARLRQRQDRIDDAIATYRLAVAVEPPPGGDARFELARLLWNRDRDAEARTLFDKLLRERCRHPERDTARYALGRIAEDDGRPDFALKHYRLLVTHGTDPALKREARWRLAWVPYRLGRYGDAAAAFAATAGISPPDRAGAYYWQARAHERDGERAAARDAYARVLEVAPESYYATLVERRLRAAAPRPETPRPLAGEPPPALTGERYHWERSRELQAAGLGRAAARELGAIARRLEARGVTEPFLLEAYRAAEAHVEALRLAARLETRGDVPPATAAAYLYPRAYWELVAAEARAQGVDPYLVLALMRQESLFDPEAESPAAAHGLMQLLVPTASRVAPAPVGVPELRDPATNVRLGTRYLRQLLDRYGGNLPRALAAYNAGEDAVAKWEARYPGAEDDELVESIGFRETRGYVKAVLGNYRRYQRLYADGAAG
jgi:soluble lytic murein transglycosylase